MARLPDPGGDDGNWGTILNDYLSQSHQADGALKDGSVTEAKLDGSAQAKLNSIAPVTSVAGKTGAVTLTATDVGLGNVNNTSDANKPISAATQAALNARVVWIDVVDANTVRPAGATRVMWIGGTVQPVNMVTGDIWFSEVA